MIELRKALDKWIEETDDKGMISEKEYIEKVGYYKDEPVTKMPEIVIRQSEIIIKSPTNGASIGYQWLDNQDEGLSKSWHIYKKPLKNIPGRTLFVRAHRIGFKPSEIIRITD